MDASLQKGRLLLTLVDHAKPFKGIWQIYQQSDTLFSACHSQPPALEEIVPAEALSCQPFSTHQQVCQFASLLQFYGWSVDDQSPEGLRFRQGCSL